VNRYSTLFLLIFGLGPSHGQNIGQFTSVTPGPQTSNFIFPTTHKFQKILEHGDVITNGTAADNFDFTGYVPAVGSSSTGYLSLNHELTPGGVTAMNVSLNPVSKLWTPAMMTALNFAPVNGTARNCSGGITSWNRVITCEEVISTADTNSDGYNDLGWMVEVDPVSKTVIRKLWALGCGQKENIVIHGNNRTAYFGNDANPGYLYKYVASVAGDLSAGILYVYTGPKNGNGNWVQIANTTQADRNNTMTLCNQAGATVFSGVEDVEIGPDGKVYLAVKNENCVYRFTDSDPVTGTTVSGFETYVGNASYNITHAGGTTVTAWGTGNDNLAFDGQGNLWVLQDGGLNYIWVVMAGHTQASPNVRLFGIAPAGSEPTGITFTPDYKYLFMSFQHPDAGNNVTYQTDAAGNFIGFDKDIALVIALSGNLGCSQLGLQCNDNNPGTFDDKYNYQCVCTGMQVQDTVSLQVSGGNNDAEENLQNNSISLTSTDLELGNDGTIPQIVGIKFDNVAIPYGSRILTANIRFTTDETSAGTTVARIKAQKSVLPGIFTTSTGNLSARTVTNDSVSWTIPAWNTIGESGPLQTAPDLSAVISEVVNQPGWPETAGSLVFLIRGTGSRIAVAWDGSPSVVPVLTISYAVQNVNNVGIGQDSPEAKLQVKDGDVYVETPGAGVIIKSPDGNCWKFRVSNTGTLTAVSVPCPGN
jgi:hypothetical protein